MQSRHSPMHKLIALLLAVSAAGCGAPPVTQVVMPAGAAAGDSALSPFYAWRGALPSKAGAMLRTEAMSSQPEISSAAVAQRILYTSMDARWNAGLLPVSGTLYLPKGTPPVGGWPVVAWAHGTLGVADVCAPSWALHRSRDATYLNRWLEKGYAVVATDYQGLGGPGPHPYLIWEAEGRSLTACVPRSMRTRVAWPMKSSSPANPKAPAHRSVPAVSPRTTRRSCGFAPRSPQA